MMNPSVLVSKVRRGLQKPTWAISYMRRKGGDPSELFPSCNPRKVNEGDIVYSIFRFPSIEANAQAESKFENVRIPKGKSLSKVFTSKRERWMIPLFEAMQRKGEISFQEFEQMVLAELALKSVLFNKLYQLASGKYASSGWFLKIKKKTGIGYTLRLRRKTQEI